MYSRKFAMRQVTDTTHRDENEPAIIAEFKARGVNCVKIAQKDVPDLLCDFKGRLFQVEVKMPGKKLSKGQEKYYTQARARNVPVFMIDHIDDVPLVVEMIDNWI